MIAPRDRSSTDSGRDGIDIHLWLLDGKTPIPTVAAAADDTVTKDPR